MFHGPIDMDQSSARSIYIYMKNLDSIRRYKPKRLNRILLNFMRKTDKFSFELQKTYAGFLKLKILEDPKYR